jgi:hypothetical protein
MRIIKRHIFYAEAATILVCGVLVGEARAQSSQGNNAAFRPQSFIRSSVSTALGMGWLAMGPEGGSLDLSHMGLSLDVRGDLRIGRVFGVSLLSDLGITEFDRTRDFAKPGIKLWDGTTGAYRKVTKWAKSDPDSITGLRWIAAGFAYFFIWTMYPVAGAMIIASPIGSISSISVGTTASFHFCDGEPDIYLEAGAGGAIAGAYHGRVGAGWGPLAGLGFKAAWYSFGAHVLWLPGAVTYGGNNGDIFIGSITAGVEL